jgi:hypothetical protein
MEVFAMAPALELEPRQKRRWGRIVARAWDDDGFRRRLLGEPASVLLEEGMDMPPGVAVRVLEGDSSSTAEETCLWLPPNPVAGDLVEDDLGLPPTVFNGTTTRFSRLTKFTKPA